MSSSVEIPKEYCTPEGLRTIAQYLRSSSNLKVKSAIQYEKRVDYFRGKKMVDSIVEAKKWPKSLPKITDREVAVAVGNLLLESQFFHQSEKQEKKGYLKLVQNGTFQESGYYTWIFAGSTTWANIAMFALILIVIGFTLLPIWPNSAKKILWYFSVTFLIFIVTFVVVRLLLFMVMWLLGYDFWIFPRIFDESLSFADSFKPMYSFEKSSEGQGYYRIILVLAVIGLGYWVCSQPAEFDGFLKAQKDFIDDLYAGNLLADVPADRQDAVGRVKKHHSFEDILRETQDDADDDLTGKQKDFSDPSDSTEHISLGTDGEIEDSEQTLTNEEELFDDLLSKEELEELETEL